MSLENNFDIAFVAELARREKQIQQHYRPIIGIHKWFARRPGTVFRSLLLAEFCQDTLRNSYWEGHEISGVIADPFAGGGTPIYEANRLGLSTVATDVNPMAYWVIRQSLEDIDINLFRNIAENLCSEVEAELGHLYKTTCSTCGNKASVKYFLWVKNEICPHCGTANDLFPGYLLAEKERHPRNVVVCSSCGELNEFEGVPTLSNPGHCTYCNSIVHVEGVIKRRKVTCKSCHEEFAYPSDRTESPPVHRLWALEYHCEHCKQLKQGRFFKKPDNEDYDLFQIATEQLDEQMEALPIPLDEIPFGDETGRLHRWGYQFYHEMFNERQLLGLGTLLNMIEHISNKRIRDALLTVFSDFLRYQNMLCRYDTYALKCQDIFSVHGFPVGFIQCENSLLGIPRVGSGSFRHFVEKYAKAKSYCDVPYEIRYNTKIKKVITTGNEIIRGTFTDCFPHPNGRQVKLEAITAEKVNLPPNSLDGVFTDPPYFDNIQYAELMDFCFVWLRNTLKRENPEFFLLSTRSQHELTGNMTLGKGLAHFTEGISKIFSHYSAALKEGAPFVFTYHHNDSLAYIPIVVAILDAGLNCVAALPVPAEMSASLHILGTKSSVLDTVFVCRKAEMLQGTASLLSEIRGNIKELACGGITVKEGDARCLLAGVSAKNVVNQLHSKWNSKLTLEDRMNIVQNILATKVNEIEKTIEVLFSIEKEKQKKFG